MIIEKTLHYPLVSIFIPTYNDQTDLLACLETIRLLDYPKEKIEILIWDNASQDNTVGMVRQLYDKMAGEGWFNLSLIEWEKNEGSYIPYNLALPYFSVECEYVLGLDADVELSPDALTNMINAIQINHIAVVGARSVYFEKPDKTSHGAGFVNLWTGRYIQKDVRKRVSCDYVIGCCWLLKKEIFTKLGFFDPHYYINHWEVDYCLRAKRKGYSIVYEPAAIAKHKISDRGTLTLERIYYLYRNKLFLMKNNFPFPQKWISMALYAFLWLPKAIVNSIFRNKQVHSQEIKTILRAMTDGCLNRGGRKQTPQS
jgi:GT2 family glycosyltransferase